MSKLKFKNFTWPHNPSTFTSSNDKNVVTHEYPEIDGSEREELGLKGRVYTGSGIFYGANAHKDWVKLSNLFRQKTRGVLRHPKYGVSWVRFTKLTSDEEPAKNFVRYSFEFVEDKEINVITKIRSTAKPKKKPAASSKRYHTVKKGDNLWNISKKYYGKGSQWPKIASANKNLIKNPNLIYPGWKLLIP